MGTRVDPQSNTWTAEGLSTILFTPTKRIICKCKDNFTVQIPESLLCYFSRYYNALLRGHFSEAGSESITLDLNAHQTKAFVTWMYSGQFAESSDYPMLFGLYVFADRVDVPAMKKDIMTFIHKRSHRRGSPANDDAVKAFSSLPESCGLVRWILDRFACHENYPRGPDAEFENRVSAAYGMLHEFACSNTNAVVPADPCCSVIQAVLCGCRSHYWEKAMRGQACAYQEHASVEEWRSKSAVLQIGRAVADMIDRLCWR